MFDFIYSIFTVDTVKMILVIIEVFFVVYMHISVKQHGRPGRTACHSAFNGVGR